MAGHSQSLGPALGVSDAFTRIAALAASVVEAPLALIVDLPGYAQRASVGPVPAAGFEIRRLVELLCIDAGGPEWLEDVHLDPRCQQERSVIRFFAAVPVHDAEGQLRAALIVSGPAPRPVDPDCLRQLEDLSSLAGREYDRHSTRLSKVELPERSAAQDQLLEKTLELAKFGEDLRQLHRLSTTNYDSIDQLFADYLDTGRVILGLSTGVVMQVRGRYAAMRAVRSDSASLRPGMTFDLSRVFCGVVSDQCATVATVSVFAEPQFRGRPHYGPVHPACYIGSPILVDGEVYGVLSFSSVNPRWREFSSHEIELMELMAKGIGRSILEGRMQLARERSEALEHDRSQVLEMVAKDRPLETVLRKIAGMVERQAPALAATVHAVRNGRLHCITAPSMPENYLRRMQGIPVPLQHGCCFSAAHTRQTDILNAPGTPHCVASRSGTCPAEFCWQACGASPIISGSGETLGVLAVYWRLAVRPWHVDSELLEMASHLAAIAMEHRELTDRLAHQAQHDVLTGLANRMMFSRTLDQRLGVMPRTAVAFIDLDRFKKINDHLGHAAGDFVLRTIASRLRKTLRRNELAARLGGDEFVILLHEFTDEADAHRRAEELLDQVRAPIEFGDRTIWVTASVGVSFHPHAGATADLLLGSADLAMYRVKNSGRNDVQIFAPGLDDQHMTRLELEHSLRSALEGDEFHPFFQPIFEIGAGLRLAGFEVLLGWEHPTLGRISPTQFIPIAEESGMIGPIGNWVLRRACRQAAEWRSQGTPEMRISVNVSALQFARPDFVETVVSALKDSGLPAEWLQLELTETAIIEDAADAACKLQTLRGLGVKLALDDFGTGYSSLGYLRSLPVDCIKIDQSFLAEVETSQGAATIIEMIVSLAHSMGLTVVAEGVETDHQLALLQKANCDMVQGHLLGTALTVEEALRRMQC